jgi:hypothetical protein
MEGWLDHADMLLQRRDRAEPLVVVPWRVWAAVVVMHFVPSVPVWALSDLLVNPGRMHRLLLDEPARRRLCEGVLVAFFLTS